MKFMLALFCAALFFVACHSNKEETDEAPVANAITTAPVKLDSFTLRLRDSITAIETAELKLGGYKLLGLRIDSISWQPASMKDFYLTRKINMEKDRENQQKVYLKLKQDGIVQNAGKLQDDSLKNIKAMQTIVNLYAHADTAQKLCLVSYRLVGRTNAAIYNTRFQKYLTAKDLKEVRLSFF